MWRNGTEVGRYDIEYPGSLPRVSPLLGRNNGFPHSLKFGRVSSSGLASSPVIILRCEGEDAFRPSSYIVQNQMKYDRYFAMSKLHASICLADTLRAVGARHDGSAHRRSSENPGLLFAGGCVVTARLIACGSSNGATFMHSPRAGRVKARAFSDLRSSVVHDRAQKLHFDEFGMHTKVSMQIRALGTFSPQRRG